MKRINRHSLLQKEWRENDLIGRFVFQLVKVNKMITYMFVLSNMIKILLQLLNNIME